MIDFEKYAKLGENFEYVNEQFQNLKKILESFKTSEGKAVKVFLQGSYKNNTNIDIESDIDIVIYYDQVFSSNIRNRTDEDILVDSNHITDDVIQKFNNTFTDVEYTAEMFKNEVWEYLCKNSNYKVEKGNKTIKCEIKDKTKSFIFDVVCAFQYRKYWKYAYFTNLQTNFIEGNIIYDQNNKRIINFPKQSYKNSDNKNKIECDGKYKETVRIFKNIMKNDIDQIYWISSFALESIIYNIDSNLFLNGNKLQRCLKIVEEAFYLISYCWDILWESNELLFVKNIAGLTQEKVQTLLLEIAKLIEPNLGNEIQKKLQEINILNNYKKVLKKQ